MGYAAETGWRSIVESEDAIPPWRYVEDMLLSRLELILSNIDTNAKPRIFLTEGRTFRYDIAVTKPYKGTRVSKKPWHYKNLSVFLYDILGAEKVTGIEADDRMAIEQTKSNGTTIIVSRDKDLRQVPGWCFSWELGLQPSFGPTVVDKLGTIALEKRSGKNVIKATGLLSFYAQVLTGDVVDNIPGLPGCGPVAAYDILTYEDEEYTFEDYTLFDRVHDAYQDYYGDDYNNFIHHLLEQGRLVWMTRRLHPDGSPVLWEIGMEE